jgi:hypothetical protein
VCVRDLLAEHFLCWDSWILSAGTRDDKGVNFSFTARPWSVLRWGSGKGLGLEVREGKSTIWKLVELSIEQAR